MLKDEQNGVALLLLLPERRHRTAGSGTAPRPRDGAAQPLSSCRIGLPALAPARPGRHTGSPGRSGRGTVPASPQGGKGRGRRNLPRSGTRRKPPWPRLGRRAATSAHQAPGGGRSRFLPCWAGRGRGRWGRRAPSHPPRRRREEPGRRAKVCSGRWWGCFR